MSDKAALQTYYLNARAEMREFIPADAERILEIGCGGGAFMASLKKTRRRRLTAIGIEPVADAALSARLHFDEVLCTSVEDGLRQLEGPFDVVVLNDVLEHLVDPWGVLKQIRPLLTPDRGRVVASIPNVRHWSTLSSLFFKGRWDYANEGVLDRTHLRFFTFESLPALFEPAGYRLERCEGINAGMAWPGRLLNFATVGRFNDCRYLQYACVGRPSG